MRETGELIAIEVEGPHEFLNNAFAPRGRIIAKHRLLVARGWAVIHVPYYMWAKLDNAVRGAWLLQARCRSCCSELLRFKCKQVSCPLQVSCHPAYAVLFYGRYGALHALHRFDRHCAGRRRYSARARCRRRLQRRPPEPRGPCPGLRTWLPRLRRSASWTALAARRAMPACPSPSTLPLSSGRLARRWE